MHAHQAQRLICHPDQWVKWSTTIVLLWFLILDTVSIFDAEMKHHPLSQREALKKRRGRNSRQFSTRGRRDETIDVTTRLQKAYTRAGYDTVAATVPERNNTVTRPLEHMITESDVPDYAELQRHHGHREKMYSFNALLNPMPCINFMQASCIPSRKHIQMIWNVLTSYEPPWFMLWYREPFWSW